MCVRRRRGSSLPQVGFAIPALLRPPQEAGAVPPACSLLEWAALQHKAEHPAALPVGIPGALWTQHQGVRVVAELSRPPGTSCPASVHVESQQTLLSLQQRAVGSEQPTRMQTQGMQEGGAVEEGIALVVVGLASGTTALCHCVSSCSQQQPQQPILAPTEMGRGSSLASVKRPEICSSMCPHTCCPWWRGEVPLRLGISFRKTSSGG